MFLQVPYCDEYLCSVKGGSLQHRTPRAAAKLISLEGNDAITHSRRGCTDVRKQQMNFYMFPVMLLGNTSFLSNGNPDNALLRRKFTVLRTISYSFIHSFLLTSTTTDTVTWACTRPTATGTHLLYTYNLRKDFTIVIAGKGFITSPLVSHYTH